MTSRLRDILTKEEYDLLVRTGSLYEEKPRSEPVAKETVADVWSGYMPRVVPVGVRHQDKPPGTLNPLKGFVSMYRDAQREHALLRERQRLERSVQTVDLVQPVVVSRPFLGCAVVSAKDDGFCYLDVVRSDMHLAVAALMKEWPSLKALLTLPGSVFVDGDVLASLSCFVSKEKVHIGSRELQSGECKVTFLTLLANLPQGALPDWASEALFGRDCVSGGVEVSLAALVGGGSGVVSKEANVDASYEMLFRDDRRGQVQQYLGSVASLSSVFAYPPQFYKSNLVDLGFVVEGGVVRFVDAGKGTRLFVLMRMMLTELMDLKTYPVLRVVRSEKLDIASLGLKAGAVPSGGDRSRAVRDVSIQRMGPVVDRLVRSLGEFESLVIERSMRRQVDTMGALGIRVEAVGKEAFWRQVVDELRGDGSRYPDEILVRYRGYVRVFDNWFQGVVLGYVSSLLLMEYGPRGTYVARVVFELLSYLGVGKLELVKVETAGMTVRVAEYWVFIPILSPWPHMLDGLPLAGLCVECGIEHYVLRVAEKVVCVSERSDALAVNLDEHMRGLYQLYGPPVISL